MPQVPKRKRQNVAALYVEDIGAKGLRKKSRLPSSVNRPSITSLPLPKNESDRRSKRLERFGTPLSDSSEAEMGTMSQMKTSRISREPVVGTSTALEKSYLRLTDFPKAEQVRPQSVLVKSLAHIKSTYVQNEDFEWANDQLKAVRQDLTVQHIRNKFVLEVYETHARLLLEHGDLNEFNQCQTVIRGLTTNDYASSDTLQANSGNSSQGGQGDVSSDEEYLMAKDQCLKQSEEAADEFLAYGLLYSLVRNSWGELTRILAGVGDGAMPKGPSTRHALKVVKSILHHDYQSFFRLYESAPHLSAYLMDFLVRRVRQEAYERIVSAFRPSISVEHVREALFFSDLEETRQFLKSNGAKFIHEIGAPPFWVDCKATFISTGRHPIPENK